jgi:hypothetical protein
LTPMEDVRDQRQYTPKSLADLNREFPDCEVWRGFNMRYYGGLKPVKRLEPQVDAEDLTELREKIIKLRWGAGVTPR